MCTHFTPTHNERWAHEHLGVYLSEQFGRWLRADAALASEMVRRPADKLLVGESADPQLGQSQVSLF